MPLRDHFFPPLRSWRSWHAFHHCWASSLATDINRRLPEGFFAEPNVKFGIEIDVGTFERFPNNGAPATPVWTGKAPTGTLPIVLVADVVEVQVYSEIEGPTLVGAIELVSPANKDRPETRDALISKCAGYLQAGVGLLMVDVVTERNANLHQELLARLSQSNGQHQELLFAAAYRSVTEDHQTRVEWWLEPLQLGGMLPTLPLWLLNGPCLPIDLEGTYEKTCKDIRIP
jgi:hypothetical protein